LALPLLFAEILAILGLSGCGGGYSPNTYAAAAAQQEAAVQRGTIIGVRQVLISPDGTIGAAAGGAAGGVAGAQVAGAPLVTALGAIGGSLVGGIGGAAAAKAVGNTKAWEYIVQEEPGDKLVSVTQTSKVALNLGLHVLVIAGTQQARIVPDYTVQTAAEGPTGSAPVAKPVTPPAAAANVEIDIGPVPASDAPAPVPAAPDTAAPVPATAPAPQAANPAPTTSAPSSVPASGATPEAANNAPQATATVSTGAGATPATPTPTPQATTPKANSPAAATP
jgi:outer membrane lipoprotein SlyB